jgi:hypothetical protein
MPRLRLALFVILAATLTACGQGPSQPSLTPGASAAATVPAGQVVEADYVRMADPPNVSMALLEHTNPLVPAQAAIVGPQYAVAFDWTTAVQGIDAHDAYAIGLPDGIAAPAGMQLFVAHLATHQPAPLKSAPGFVQGVQVIVAGKARPASVDFRSGELLIVAAPPDAPVAISLTDDGRTQTLNLRTGKRGADANPLFYTHWAMAKFSVHTIPALPGLGDTALDGPLTLAPWTGDHGWAPSGKAWLRFYGFVYADLGYTDGEVLDVARSVSLVSGGKTYQPAAGKIPVFGASTITFSNYYAIDIAVPTGFRRGTLKFHPKVTCHGCDTGRPTSASVELTAGAVPMAN